MLSRRVRMLAASGVATAAVGSFAVVASAATPPPEGKPGCQGRIVAEFNHNSGVFGPSGNPNSSSGPGFFLKQETSQKVHEVKEAFCG